MLLRMAKLQKIMVSYVFIITCMDGAAIRELGKTRELEAIFSSEQKSELSRVIQKF